MEKNIENKKISAHDFYFEMPLYEELKISNIEEDFWKNDVDAYNHIENSETTYSLSCNSITSRFINIKASFDNWDQSIWNISLSCKRKKTN